MAAAYAKKAFGKMRAHPAPAKEDKDEGMDPAFEIPDDQAHEDGGDTGGEEPTLAGGTDDSDSDERGEENAHEGDMSPEKRGEGHEDEHDKLAECSDDDLLKELKARGHPAGAMHGMEKKGSKGKSADKAGGEHGEEQDAAEEYSE